MRIIVFILLLSTSAIARQPSFQDMTNYVLIVQTQLVTVTLTNYAYLTAANNFSKTNGFAGVRLTNVADAKFLKVSESGELSENLDGYYLTNVHANFTTNGVTPTNNITVSATNRDGRVYRWGAELLP